MFDSDNDLWVSGNKERFQDEKENAKEHSLSNDNANRKLKNAIFHVSVVDIRWEMNRSISKVCFSYPITFANQFYLMSIECLNSTKKE
mgnify:CR=1 FL=1